MTGVSPMRAPAPGLKRLAAVAVLLSVLAAGSARAGGLFDPTLACRRAADRALCVLKALADDDGGSLVWRDQDLQRAPAVLADLGLTAAGVAAARGANAAERVFFGATDAASAAVAETLTLDRAGRAPADALAPILALSTTSPAVPPFFMRGGEMPSPRAEAYQALLASAESLARPPSPTLAAAGADAWERDLRDPAAPRMFRTSAYELALARLVLRDAAGMDRAVAMIPSPFRRITLLADLGRFDDAVRAALALRRADALAVVRADMTAEVERYAQVNAAAARAASEGLPQMLRDAGRLDDPETAKLMRQILRENARAAKAPPPVPALPAAEVARETDDRIGQMQDYVLMTAVRKQRAEAVRPLADRLLQEPALPDNRYRFPRVLKTATPAVAVARLEALESELTPTKGAGRLEPLVLAWIQVGRPDRADQLVERAAAWARAGSGRRPTPYAEPVARELWARGRQAESAALTRLAPDERLKLDIKAGRGLADYDRYLADAVEGERPSLIVGCDTAAVEAKAWPVAVACAERQRGLSPSPQQRHGQAGIAMHSAARAADADEMTAARRLFDISVDAAAEAVAADPQTRTWPLPFSTPDLLAYAKGELRADGRLAPRPSPPRP